MKIDLNNTRSFFDEESDIEELQIIYSAISPIHKAACEIIDLERRNFYGDSQEARIQNKVKEIIVKHAKEINSHETD